MRISDWSSDVCSSDLRSAIDQAADEEKAVRQDDIPLWRRYLRERKACRPAFVLGLRRQCAHCLLAPALPPGAIGEAHRGRAVRHAGGPWRAAAPLQLPPPKTDRAHAVTPGEKAQIVAQQ